MASSLNRVLLTIGSFASNKKNALPPEKEARALLKIQSIELLSWLISSCRLGWSTFVKLGEQRNRDIRGVFGVEEERNLIGTET